LFAFADPNIGLTINLFQAPRGEQQPSRVALARDPYPFLMQTRSIPNGSLTRFGRKNAAPIWRRCAMADVVYLVLGLLFFALMSAYAIACDRL
jgi:hypothetical protein